MSTQGEAFVDIDGIRYHTLYELPDSQNEHAPCILLVHALMSNLHMWNATVKALHEVGYSTLRFDHIGHNKTSLPSRFEAVDDEKGNKPRLRRISLGGPLAYSIDDIARHMHRIVEARTGQSHVKAVMGCSIGGTLAIRYAIMFPKDLDQAVSFCMPGVRVLDETKPLWSQRIQLFEEDQKNGSDKLCHATVDRWIPGSGQENDAVRRECLGHVKTCSIQGYTFLADTIRNFDFVDQIGQIEDVKCLIVAGSDDKASDAKLLKQIASQIQGAEFIEVKSAGHLPPMQKSKEVNELTLRFLQRK